MTEGFLERLRAEALHAEGFCIAVDGRCRLCGEIFYASGTGSPAKEGSD